jgi:prepilin peptidase CpaA
VAAVLEDVFRRRISNWICVVALLAGLILQIAERGWQGGISSLLGALTGGAVFLVFYLLGGMGGGDIKLMAGFGAILGAHGILEASLWTAGCGGIMAVAWIAINEFRRRFLNNRPMMSPTLTKDSNPRLEQPQRESMPYAPAIAAGVWLSLVGRT